MYKTRTDMRIKHEEYESDEYSSVDTDRREEKLLDHTDEKALQIQ